MSEIKILQFLVGAMILIYLITMAFVNDALEDIKEENRKLRKFFQEIFQNNFCFSTKDSNKSSYKPED